MAMAVAGVVTSTAFLLLVLVAALRYRRRAALAQAAVNIVDPSHFPPVAVLKPVHGAEPRLEQNLETFFLQDYPDYHIIFGMRAANDPALDVINRLRHKYPNIPVQIVFSGHPTWPNAKVYSLDRMLAATTCNFLVISDSDISVTPDFLRHTVTPLLERCNGLVTCLYRGVPANGFWSEVEAIGMSVDMPSGVVVADMLEGMRFALGAAMIVRRDALEKIGGFPALADYYSDDFVLGNLIAAAGYNVVLSHHKVSHVLVAQTFRSTFRTQLRWAKSTRYSRPSGHIGSGLTFATPFGLLALFSGVLTGHAWLGVGSALWSLLNRMLQAVVVDNAVIQDPRTAHRFWLYPIRDFIGFIVWAGSFLGGRSFAWRDEIYRFTPGGKIIAAARQVSPAPAPQCASKVVPIRTDADDSTDLAHTDLPA